MSLETGRVVHGFLLKEEKEIKELNAAAKLFLHEKSGARLLYLQCEDDNKVFSISFRTPPQDSTGLPHILEHSVLCGSRKFPTKEPFVELAKGSLNTFLNAMTYPDKTVYPIASRNDKDFINLMDVYLDAVFYPNIYQEPETLMQEGWHYELEDKEEPLRYKGVVYNEMKGAFSSPEQVLFRKIQESLYPDTPYGFESGGDPEVIPDLTLEQFLDFHKKYYHPSNSYIYLYGNGDIEEHLRFIHEEYLNNFEQLTPDSEITIQPPFPTIKQVEVEYPISSDDHPAEKTYLSLNYSVGRSTDPFLYLAFNILEYLLLDNPAAPIKKALLEAGIGKDVFGAFDSSLLQPTFSIVAKNTNAEDTQAFQDIIQKTLRDLTEKGIDKRLVEAAINFREFKLREADFGGRPKGLIYGIRCMDSWLYGEDPTLHLYYEDTLAKIKTALTEPLFEELIKKYLLDNTHCSLLVVKPKPGLAEARDKEIHEKLQAYKVQLSDTEIEDILQNTRELKRKQAEPDSPEALATIPMVALSDIDAQAEALPLVEKSAGGVKVLSHPMFTNGIAYLTLWFDTRRVPQELLPYTGLLVNVLGEISTQKYHYEELSKEINIHTGGIEYGNQAFALNGRDGEFVPKFMIKAKALVDKLPKLIELLQELTTQTVFSDTKRIREIIQEARSRMEMGIHQSGHLMAFNRLSSYFSPAGKYTEILSGIEFFHFLVGLEKNFDQQKDDIVQKLEQVYHLIFQREHLIAGITLSEADYPRFEEELSVLTEALGDEKIPPVPFHFEVSAENEGLMTPGKVQYVAKGYSYLKTGHAYHGSLQVLRTIASLDYLWNRIRVQGGAYGAFAHFTRSGAMLFGSYRDPNLKETLTVYDQMPQYLSSFNADEREMTKYIIGTISRMDAPLTPPMKGERADVNYFTHLTQQDIQRERDQVLQTTAGDIQKLERMVSAVLENPFYCVVGSEGKLKENKDLFKKLVNIFE